MPSLLATPPATTPPVGGAPAGTPPAAPVAAPAGAPVAAPAGTPTTAPVGGPPAGAPEIPAWRASLPEDLRGAKSLDVYKGKSWDEVGPNLVRSLVSAQAMVGADKVVIPGPNASQEQVAEYRAKLGIPAAPADYKFNIVGKDGKPVELDKDLVSKWADRMHKVNVPTEAANAMVAAYVEDQLAEQDVQKAAIDKQSETWYNETQTRFGKDLDTTLNYARLIATQYIPKPLMEVLVATGLDNHPDMVGAFAKLGRDLESERPGRQTVSSGNIGNMPAPVAQAELDRMHRTMTVELTDVNHPNHVAAVKRRAELLAAAFPPSV